MNPDLTVRYEDPAIAEEHAPRSIAASFIEPSQKIPFVMEPHDRSLDLIDWAGKHARYLEQQLLQYGAILFRNFNISSIPQFEQFAARVTGQLLNYYERSTPRKHVAGKVYTSTDYPADQYIPIHNECAYSYYWPMKVCFYCLQPAQEGGRTPLADSRNVLGMLSASVRNRFAQKRVMYIRNYHEGLDIPWQTAFQTDDKAVVETYCREVGMECEWLSGSWLRTRQVRDAIARHPKTGDAVWFNQAHAFHVSNLEPAVRDFLLGTFKEEDLPRHVCYGDGSRVEDEALSEIRAVYKAASRAFPWQEHDILMVDNMLAAHGREPFVGPRNLVVAMGDGISRTHPGLNDGPPLG